MNDKKKLKDIQKDCLFFYNWQLYSYTWMKTADESKEITHTMNKELVGVYLQDRVDMDKDTEVIEIKNYHDLIWIKQD